MKVVSFSVKIIVFSVVIFFASSFIHFSTTTKNPEPEEPDPAFIKYKNHWIDSVYSTMSLDEKIGQLIMVAAYSNMGNAHKRTIETIIKKYKPGGLVLFQGGPVRQANLTNYYQTISKTPLLIAMDAEWSISMRLDSTVKYPRQMLMGAIQNDKILYDFGLEVGRQCKRMGVHINFAPVVDVNNNPRNPVINSRSFGEDRSNVARKSFAYMFGMQEQNIIATAKHFPGHGDTESDSHKTLPVINHSFQRLDSLELYPFKYLIQNGLAAVMVAHLHIPALDSANYSASSLSHNVVTGLLKKKLGFKGLVFTDALGMQGVSNYNSPGIVAVKSFLAGSDILLMPTNVGAAINEIKAAIESGQITEEQINKRCYKILQAKNWVGLDDYKPVKIKGLIHDLNSSEAKYIKRKIIESAITLVENKNDIIPFKGIDSLKIASVSIGSRKYTQFQKTLSLYDNVKHFVINKNANLSEFKALITRLTKYDVVILGFHRSNRRPSSFGISGSSIWFAHELSKYTKVVIDVFANPYILSRFKRDKFSAIVMSYEDTKLSQDLSGQLLYGGIPALGRLPVSSGKEYPVRTGITDEKIRLKYAIPKELNIDDIKLQEVDSIVADAISQKAIPGCQILAIKNGVVFYNKSFGYHTYKKNKPVTNDDLYDLASLTKITATLPTIMKLSEEGKININSKLSTYIKELDSTDKKNISLKQVLAHQSRLMAWIPFYLKTYDTSGNSRYKLDPKLYNSKQDSVYQLRVVQNIYMRKTYIDSIYAQIIDSPLRKRTGYRYSDLGFYLFYKMIADRIPCCFPDYLQENFYSRLGSTTLCYNPIDKFSKDRIVPTEIDKRFRKQTVHGYVHDYGAAMMGGVSGHAGLFSNANDLAKVMQMYLQKGEYGGEQFINPKTIDLFTRRAYSKSNNRRALGFDRPGSRKKSPVSRFASSTSYGHTGFTGTIAWVDPKEQFVYVFLSNRIYPDADNRKLIKMEVRTKIQEAFYRAF